MKIKKQILPVRLENYKAELSSKNVFEKLKENADFEITLRDNVVSTEKKTFYLARLQNVSGEHDNRRVQGNDIRPALHLKLDLVAFYPLVNSDNIIDSFMFVVWDYEYLLKNHLTSLDNPSLKIKFEELEKGFESENVERASFLKYKADIYKLEDFIGVYLSNPKDKSMVPLDIDMDIIPILVTEHIDYKTHLDKKAKSKGITKKSQSQYINDYKDNMETGYAGEILAVNFEKNRLISEGAPESIVNSVKHVSSSEGDGLGYDIISWAKSNNLSEYEEIQIEVKSTTSTNDFGFFISENERLVSIQLNDTYYIYRVSLINSEKPELRIYKGSFESNFEMKSQNYVVIGMNNDDLSKID